MKYITELGFTILTIGSLPLSHDKNFITPGGIDTE